MAFNKVDLFEKTKALWPAQIDLSVMVINGRHVKGGQILVELYNRLESSFDENDHWNQIAIWAFYQCIWPFSSDYSEDDASIVLLIEDVTFEKFDEKMRENLLGDDCWKDEREIYIGADEIGKSGKGTKWV